MRSLLYRFMSTAEKAVIKTISEPRLMTIQLDITNACNLSCSHCYHPHHSNAGALSLNDWKLILQKIASFLEKYSFYPRFMFCGGEPLLSPLLKPLVAQITQTWPTAQTAILTNGTIFKDTSISYLKPSLTSFQVSLDGPDEARHDSVRGSGSFKKSLIGIEKMLKYGYEVSILSILSQRTANWIPEYFLLAKRMGVNSQNFTRLIAQGHGKKLVDAGTDMPLAGNELREAFTKVIFESYRSDIPTNTDQPLFALIDKSFGQSGLFGFDALVVDYKGNLKVTSRSSLILGNLVNSDLEDIYIKNPILNDIRDAKIDVCGSCEFYSSCGGDRNAAFAEFGSFTARDPGCWR